MRHRVSQEIPVLEGQSDEISSEIPVVTARTDFTQDISIQKLKGSGVFAVLTGLNLLAVWLW